ncbi:hypothetical protein [Novosphingobium sp.]|uniref:hypothetical protein n=1 Tax=Novosphingobium sp. TaxID=1874826 RepID=UPI0031E27645
MTKFGSQFSSTDPLKKADGRSHDAGVRSFENVFDLTVDGGTNQALKIAEIQPGVHAQTVTLDTDQNLSAINFTVGTADTPAKYGASTAGPNATQKTIYVPLSLGLGCTTVNEEIFLYPSANMPAAGSLKTRMHCSKR